MTTSVDLPAAAAFLARHARPLDRHRFAAGFDAASPAGLLAGLDGYRNADGGYGWGLEPDLRSASSQPAGALHALEALVDAAPEVSPRAAEVCDWLASITLPGGGLPFALPVPDPAGCAPFWLQADPRTPSLQLTAVVAARAHQVARHDPAVAAHPWLARATAYCLDAAAVLGPDPFAIELAFTIWLLDEVAPADPRARELLAQLGQHIPADGHVPVTGGAEGETMRPLDLSPRPGSASRALFAPGVVEADLERLVADQDADGGWRVDFDSYSPAAALEWRGHRTVAALEILRDHGRLD